MANDSNLSLTLSQDSQTINTAVTIPINTFRVTASSDMFDMVVIFEQMDNNNL